MRISIIFFLLIIFVDKSYGQLFSRNEIHIEEKQKTGNNKWAYSQLSVATYDYDSKRKLLPIIKIGSISIFGSDTTSNKIYVKKGSYKFQVGCVGYLYSKKIKIRTVPNKDYHITVKLKADTSALE